MPGTQQALRMAQWGPASVEGARSEFSRSGSSVAVHGETLLHPPTPAHWKEGPRPVLVWHSSLWASVSTCVHGGNTSDFPDPSGDAGDGMCGGAWKGARAQHCVGRTCLQVRGLGIRCVWCLLFLCHMVGLAGLKQCGAQTWKFNGARVWGGGSLWIRQVARSVGVLTVQSGLKSNKG